MCLAPPIRSPASRPLSLSALLYSTIDLGSRAFICSNCHGSLVFSGKQGAEQLFKRASAALNIQASHALVPSHFPSTVTSAEKGDDRAVKSSWMGNITGSLPPTGEPLTQSSLHNCFLTGKTLNFLPPCASPLLLTSIWGSACSVKTQCVCVFFFNTLLYTISSSHGGAVQPSEARGLPRRRATANHTTRCVGEIFWLALIFTLDVAGGGSKSNLTSFSPTTDPSETIYRLQNWSSPCRYHVAG